ncbi:Rieske (2Fe-2S) domain-containing protein [Novosphingobium resinovorum]|uniref:Rieske (2Fe-2S) domain-containing protein n=2 Tax=Novosphingobium resinovorum TaxID=158500 RepID=A0A031K0U3_9SPHN|nr:Rieske (2Fe-2S) domain-containing protein [Novosphingobium resinovorum]
MATMSETFHSVIAEADFPEEGKAAIMLGGWSVLIVKVEDGFRAVNDRCTHQAALLSPGRVRRGAIMCPLHGARFEAATGRCIGGAYADLRVFPLRIEGGMIEVAVPDEAPGPNERPVGA